VYAINRFVVTKSFVLAALLLEFVSTCAALCLISLLSERVLFPYTVHHHRHSPLSL
jgi:hypothetical protein